MLKNQRWKILFMGTDQIAVETLKALHGSNHLVGSLDVLCPPDRKAGRGKKNRVVPVKRYALENSIPYFHTPDAGRSLKNWRLPTQKIYDIGVVVSFGYKIRDHMMEKMTRGAINMHPSLLPKYRGAAPITHTLLNGDTTTGVSVIDIDLDRFDTGRILYQEKHPVTPGMTCNILSEELAVLGASGIINVLTDLERYRACASPQNDDLATPAPKIRKEDGIIDWTDDASTIVRKWQALSSSVGVRTAFCNRILQIAKLKVHASSYNTGAVCLVYLIQNLTTVDFGLTSPGDFMFDPVEKHLCVKCGDGAFVFVERVKVEGRKEMEALDFVNGFNLRGAAQSFQPNESLLK